MVGASSGQSGRNWDRHSADIPHCLSESQRPEAKRDSGSRLVLPTGELLVDLAGYKVDYSAMTDYSMFALVRRVGH